MACPVAWTCRRYGPAGTLVNVTLPVASVTPVATTSVLSYGLSKLTVAPWTCGALASSNV